MPEGQIPAVNPSSDLTTSLPSQGDWQVLQQQLNEIDQASSVISRQIPPLERWQPAFCGEMDMVIKANGEWWHEGRKLTRQSMIDLFSKVLWAEVDAEQKVRYYLKTPVEKLGIRVEDAPLLVIQVDCIEQNGKGYLQFTTSQGDTVIADSEHPIRLGLPFQQSTGEGVINSAQQMAQPYVLVRTNGASQLYALIHRNAFYHLVDMGELVATATGAMLKLTSGDSEFLLYMDNIA